MQRIRERHLDLALYCIFGVIVGLLYHSALKSYFLYDDPFMLRAAVTHAPWEYFYKPRVWHQFNVSYLTPWVPLSYGIDLRLSGINPKLFYLHQLVAVWLTAIVLYEVLKIWTGKFAAIGSVLFLVSAPVAATTEILMFRAYIEGSLFLLLSLFFFVRSLRNASCFYSFLSAVFYAAAISAKEIFLPLGVLVFFLPEGDLNKRTLRAAPLIGVLALYILWRYWMLGSLLAGPGGKLFPGYEGGHWVTLFIKDFYGSLGMLSGIPPAGSWVTPAVAGVFFCFVAASSIILAQERNYLPVAFFALTLFSVYVVPLSIIHFSTAAADSSIYRLMVLVDICLVAVLTASASFLYLRLKRSGQSPALRKALEGALLFVLGGTTLLVFQHATAWIRNERELVFKPLAEEGRFFMAADKDVLLVKSAPLYGGFYYYENLEYFRRLFLHEQSPLVAYDVFAFVDDPGSPVLRNRRVYKYNRATSAMTEITGVYMKERAAFFARVRVLPLEVRLTSDGGDFRYFLGPSSSGRYFLLLGYRPDLYCMRVEMRQFAIRIPTSIKMYCRAGWESPDGLVTFSPEWFIDSSKKQDIFWERR
jgi:hypothetical protein